MRNTRTQKPHTTTSEYSATIKPQCKIYSIKKIKKYSHKITNSKR